MKNMVFAMRGLVCLFLVASFANCQSQQRTSDDLNIYGGLPKPPMPPKPAMLKRKTPNTPTALCHDGKYTFSRNVDFTCSGHGGVKQWTYQSDIEIKPDKNNPYYED